MAHMVLNFSYATFKNNYWQYHLFNLFLFVLVSFLIYLLIENLTGNHYLAFLTGFLSHSSDQWDRGQLYFCLCFCFSGDFYARHGAIAFMVPRKEK